MLINSASGEVQEGIEDFCTDRRPDDQLMIYLSCHGVLDSYGRLYYAATNTRRQRLAATAVAAAWLNERLEDCRAHRQILVLDCCHSGAFAKGAKGDGDLALQHRFESHGRGRVVLTASRSTEYSFESGQASGEGVPSVFTHAIVHGLRTGDADRDKDGLITVTDLYQYVYDRVRAAEPRQNPELWTYGAEGDLLVAHSVRGAVIEPEPLPEDLRMTLESPRRRVRETGVAELADLLDAAGPGLALAARQALERIAEEDHPQVAALARIAVGAPAGAAADHVRRELTDRAHREEHARQEAARREAEEKARREAEEKARREAEEKARREAEEKARREAEEKARREAEEKARREAEEKARREAEEKARREAEEKARREAVRGATQAAATVGRHDVGRRDQTVVSPRSSPEATPPEPKESQLHGRSRRTWAWAGGGLAAVCVIVVAILVGVTPNHPAGTPNHPAGTPTASVGYGAAISSVINPSAHKGGTIIYDNSSPPESTDPGNTYYPFNWDFTRLYAMPLMTYKSCPGSCGLQVVPDLATAPGIASNDGLTWTYHIHPDVKFENGQTVTSADVKYAVERTFDRSMLGNGPFYFQTLLGGNAATYPGPYKDRSANLMGLTAVTTPNATTVVFHLAHPFADFNYVAAIPQTAPVPPDKDTGANYQLHPISTGPYKFASYQLNKQITLVPNTEWNPSADPNASQLASKIIVNLNIKADDIDNRLVGGGIQMDQAGGGVQAAARAQILSTPSLKSQADDPINGSMSFYYINTKVPPLNNVHCRMAIEYAANKATLQTAYGGPEGGDIASTAMPPNIIGFKSFDLYDALSKPGGDVAAAKQQLAACGHPNGFTTNIAYRSDRPKDVASSRALQSALATVGIKAGLKGRPIATYYTDFAGSPAYVHSHDLGLAAGAWGADWPDAWSWFNYLVSGNTIVPNGNTNISELNDPVVNSDLAAMQQETSDSARNAYANKIDMQVMKDAVILPAVYAKVLLYRSPELTNVYVQPYYGMYNYAVLGLK